jgi:hypothetical protein
MRSVPTAINVDDNTQDTNPTSAAGLSEMPPPKKQKTLLDFQPLSSTSEKVCTAVVTKFIATAMQPFNIVECQPFVEMVKTLNPRYTLPGRKYFSKTSIPKLFNETKQKIKSDLCLTRNNNVSITTDCWTSASSEPFITITAHYINDNWELKSPCLCCGHFNDDHTAENIIEILQEKLSEWNLNINQLCSCTTDNGANILKAISLSVVQHVPCFGHTINIGINKALKIQILSKAVAKLKKLQNSFAHSWKMSRDLSQAQELMQMKTLRLPSACPTRWGSTLKLCKRFLDNQLPVSKVLFDYPSKKFLMLEQNEVSALEDFVESTTLMEDMTKHLSGEKYTTASSLVPLLQKIKKRMQPKDTDRRLVKEMKSEILSALDEYYFECSELMELLNLTTACDPRFRLNYAGNKEEVKTVLLQHMLDVYEHSANESISDNSENKNPKKCGLEKLLESDSDDDKDQETIDDIPLPVRKVEIELKNYLSMPKTMLNQDPLTWWKSHGESFPSLRVIAKKLLAVQGTSVPSERVFSAGGNVITKNRASLLPKNAEMQVFLAQNRNII